MSGDPFEPSVATIEDHLARACHELRTPVAVLGMLVEAVQHPAITADQARRDELLAAVAPQVVRLRALLRRYVDHGRLEFAAPEGTATCVDVAEVVSDTLDRLRPLVPNDRVLRRLEPAPVLADPEQVGSIVENLVLNAVAFSPDDAEVEVRTRVHDRDLVELVVRDAGVGIPAEEVPHVLRPWFRGTAARGSDGAGLGLAVVAGHVAALGGSVAISSEVGAGTHVRVLLPGDGNASRGTVGRRRGRRPFVVVQ